MKHHIFFKKKLIFESLLVYIIFIFVHAYVSVFIPFSIIYKNNNYWKKQICHKKKSENKNYEGEIGNCHFKYGYGVCVRCEIMVFFLFCANIKQF